MHARMIQPLIHPCTALRRCALRLGAAVLIVPLASAPVSAAPPAVVDLPAPQPAPSAAPSPVPAPAPLELPPAAAERQPVAAATPRAAAPVIAPPRDAAPGAGDTPADSTAAGDTLTTQTLPEPAAPFALPSEIAASPAAPADPSSALGGSVLPGWWPWAAGALVAILALSGVLLTMRRRRPKVLRLAAPATGTGQGTNAAAAADQAPVRLDCQFDILAAARSMMMFTIEFRLEIANRSPRAVRDLAVTTRLGYPGRTGEETALAQTAENIQTIERIGPHQSRSITGTLRLPLSEIAPIRQGAAPLLIPLIHALLESPDLPRETRMFVAGTPSPANLGRLQPIRLDIAPGGITGLRALPVNAR
jgi:hypothetical protein